MSLVISFEHDFTKARSFSEVVLDRLTMDALMLALKKPLTDIMDKEDKDWGYGFVGLYESKHHIDLSELNDKAFNKAYQIVMDEINKEPRNLTFLVDLQEKFKSDPRFNAKAA